MPGGRGSCRPSTRKRYTSKRDESLLIGDILEAIGRIEEYTAGYSKEGFFRDRKTIDAVIRNLEIIGEACGQVPEPVRAEYPLIPWKRIVEKYRHPSLFRRRSRDRLVHHYATTPGTSLAPCGNARPKTPRRLTAHTPFRLPHHPEAPVGIGSNPATLPDLLRSRTLPHAGKPGGRPG